MRTLRILAEVSLFAVVKPVFAYMVASAEGTFQGNQCHRVLLDSRQKIYKINHNDFGQKSQCHNFRTLPKTGDCLRNLSNFIPFFYASVPEGSPS
jgi:hypothetical protein